LVPVRYAIAAHTVDRFDYDTATYRVADDVRTIDKLDMLGGAGLIRCVAHYALDESISFLPYGGEASSPTVLWPWWRITKNLYPIEYSAYARDNACDAVGWGEEIMNDELTHEQPYHDILALLFDLINEIENLVADNCYERLDARMGELGADDYHRWGEILEGTATRIEDEEHGRSRSRVLARRTGDPLLSGMADLLEMGPGGWGTEAIRAQAAQVYQDAEARDE
jgi:hypothetical protein